VVIAAREEASAPSQLWTVSPSGGGARMLTNGLSDYSAVSVAARRPCNTPAA